LWWGRFRGHLKKRKITRDGTNKKERKMCTKKEKNQGGRKEAKNIIKTIQGGNNAKRRKTAVQTSERGTKNL